MERAYGPGVPETWESELLPSILELLKSQFAELRSHLAAELCDAVRLATVPSLPSQRESRRESREVELVTRSQASGEISHHDEADSRSMLRPRGFLSQKLLAELGEEEHVEKPGPLWGDQTLSIHAHHAVSTAHHAVNLSTQPLRNLLRPSKSSSGMSTSGASGPLPPEVHEPQILEVAKALSGGSDSEVDELAIAPPTEPAPALNSSASSPHVFVTAPSVSGRRGTASLTEKAFGLQRGGSITSLDVDRSYWVRVKLLRCVQNAWFETLSMFMLCANAVVIGVQTDYMAVNKLSSTPWGMRALDIWFCFFFTLELVLRILAHGRRFFSMNGCAWNMMDLILVSAYVAETVLLIVADVETNAEVEGSSNRVAGTNPEIMRVIRILRAIKVVRLVGAVRFTQDLQLLINCLFRSLKQFLWSALLLLLAIYVVAIYITQAATAYRLENIDGQQVQMMLKWWGSMPQSVLSLFQGVTGGVDWHQIADPLIDGISPWFGLFFIVFMAFCILALLNVITGTFVETMSQQAKELQLRNRIYQARRLFKEIDIDGSGFISPDEILGQTDTPAVQEFFETIDVDPSDAKGLLEVIDIDGNGKINFEEFLEGSLRLNGSAKSSDLIMLAREMKRFQANQLRELAAIKEALSNSQD